MSREHGASLPRNVFPSSEYFNRNIDFLRTEHFCRVVYTYYENVVEASGTRPGHFGIRFKSFIFQLSIAKYSKTKTLLCQIDLKFEMLKIQNVFPEYTHTRH